MNAPDTPGYTMNHRSLERWRDRGLKMEPAPDGGIEAVFRYEGSTCGGVPLAMIYRVSLSPEGEGRRIRALSCAPEPGDEGHERMCSYMHTGGRIMGYVTNEKPLLGEPLETVLSWRPKIFGAGCLCAEPSRMHKWSAVLQTIHFTLYPPPPEPAKETTQLTPSGPSY